MENQKTQQQENRVEDLSNSAQEKKNESYADAIHEAEKFFGDLTTDDGFLLIGYQKRGNERRQTIISVGCPETLMEQLDKLFHDIPETEKIFNKVRSPQYKLIRSMAGLVDILIHGKRNELEKKTNRTPDEDFLLNNIEDVIKWKLDLGMDNEIPKEAKELFPNKSMKTLTDSELVQVYRKVKNL